MSAAIMHTASLYDFGDFFLKNQTTPRAIVHLQNQQNGNNNNNNITPSTNTNSTNLLNNNLLNNTNNTAITNGNTTTNPQIWSNVCSSMQSLLTNNGNATHLGTPNQQQIHQSINNTAAVNTVNSSLLNNNNINLNSTAAAAAVAATSPVLLQQHLNAVVAAQQQQQQQEQQQKMLIHNALSRAVSHPQNGNNVVNLMNTLIENLGGHRRLERTQSEPLPQVNTSRYKTELCRPFEEAGECKYGEKCQFAHGAQELRNLQRHPKYKTEFCRTFHSVGFCPYGPRCHFVHNADEARIIKPTTYAEAGFLPLSPPLSMSTGSDRASPTGSLSLSPTNSMASFPYGDQISPASLVFTQAFTFNSPPASPQSGLSPVATPSPPPIVPSTNIVPQTQQSVTFTHLHNKHSPTTTQNLIGSSTNNKQSLMNTANNNAIAAAAAVAATAVNLTNLSKLKNDEARLPVFNRLSSTVEAFTNLSI